MSVAKLRKAYRLSQPQLEELTGIPFGRINGWEQQGSSPNGDDSEILNFTFSALAEFDYKKLSKGKRLKAEDISILKKFLEDNKKDAPLDKYEKAINKLITNEIKTNHIQLRQNLKTGEMKPIETDVKFTAGQIVQFDDEPNLIVEPIKASYLEDAPYTVEVTNESMLPTIKPGDRVALKKLNDKTMIMPGEIYFIVDTENERVAKRLYYKTNDKSAVLLRSDNETKNDKGEYLYPEFERKWEQIIAVYRIKADITLH